VSSRLATGTRGEVVVVETTEEFGAPTGTRWLALGNDLPCNARGFHWLGTCTGRAPSLHEQAVPVDTLDRRRRGGSHRGPVEVPDEQLVEA
jgi:hypothetical protein